MMAFFLSTVSSGTVTINADSSVQILAEEAVPMERLDPQVKHLGELWAATISGIIIKCGKKIIYELSVWSGFRLS